MEDTRSCIHAGFSSVPPDSSTKSKPHFWNNRKIEKNVLGLIRIASVHPLRETWKKARHIIISILISSWG